jgi:hypothetical protein
METENQLLQKRLNAVQAQINFLGMEKERNDKEKKVIEEELKKLNVKDKEELKKLIEDKEKTLILTKTKFDVALKKLEDKTTELENKVKS